MLVDLSSDDIEAISKRQYDFCSFTLGLKYISRWLNENCAGEFSFDTSEFFKHDSIVISFDNDGDAVLFKLVLF